MQPVRTRCDQRRAGHDDHAEGPEPAERRDRPPLERLRGRRTAAGPRDQRADRLVWPRSHASAIMTRNAAGIGDLHDRVDVARRLRCRRARAARARSLPRAALRSPSSRTRTTTISTRPRPRPQSSRDHASDAPAISSSSAIVAPDSACAASASTASSTSRQVAVAGVRDDPRARRPGAMRAPAAAARTSARRRDQRAERAVEAPLRRRTRDGAPAPGGPARRTSRARAPRSAATRGQLAAADGEAQAVAGHRIDEAAGVAGEQQASRNPTPERHVHGERPEHHRRRHLSGASPNRSRSTGSRASASASIRRGSRSPRSPPPAGIDDADVGQPPGSGATPM